MTKKAIMLEICVDSIASCLAAKKGGADRLELCECIAVGGLTPSFGKIAEARKIEDIKLNILIRPRSGDFYYSNRELEIMKHDIEMCARLKCDGIVFGILTKDRKIDMAANSRFIKLAHKHGLSTTFHRAFDVSFNLFESLENAITLGFDRILTSGGKETAMKGMYNIKLLIEKANEQIIIMPGSGINENNVEIILKERMAKEIHGTFSTQSGNLKGNENIIDIFSNNSLRGQTDAEKVMKAKHKMNEH